MMERKVAGLAIGGLLLVVFLFSRNQLPIMKGLTAAGHTMAGDSNRRGANVESLKETEFKLPGLENEDVVITGPLISWMREEEREAPQTNTSSTRAPASSDHVVFSPRPKPKNFLHAVFSVKNYIQFTFVVPPNTVGPKPRGNFRSFPKSGQSVDDGAADVDVVVLTEQEFNGFLHHRAGMATFELDASHNQVVNYALPPTQDEGQKYHLVFRNSAGTTKIASVEADFTVSLE